MNTKQAFWEWSKTIVGIGLSSTAAVFVLPYSAAIGISAIGACVAVLITLRKLRASA